LNINKTSAWQALSEHHCTLANLHMRDLFNGDPERFLRFSIETPELFLDYSKNRITAETLYLLMALVTEARLTEHIDKMFQGEKINTTEQRAVLHTALRSRTDRPIYAAGEDVMPEIRAVLARLRILTEAVRSGRWRGYSDEPMTDIVNIGIGGSHLGPLMVTRALKPYQRMPQLRMHFVSNVDGTDLQETLDQIKPETTLFIIASKTFTTQETMTNAHTARDWLLQRVNDQTAIARHFVAISTHLEATRAFGIDETNVFKFWDFVGGRYSLWSAIGLPIALMIGMDAFEELLTGAYDMDEHFRRADLEHNMPVILGVLGLWYTNFFGAETQAIIPYDQRLEYLPAYLQQLVMESNGKRISRDGEVVSYSTGPILWGAPGTNSQHAFFQLIHQGTQLVPLDLLAPLENPTSLDIHHDLLLANCFAQAEALMRGKTEEEVREELIASGLSKPELERLLPHKVFPGNKPSTMILYGELTPQVLGALIALYEHRVFVEGVLWNINSFDQWGVELGKQLAATIVKEFHTNTRADHDASTRGLIERYKQTKATAIRVSSHGQRKG
jgi:glucose-6-phosphate isomerase